MSVMSVMLCRTQTLVHMFITNFILGSLWLRYTVSMTRCHTRLAPVSPQMFSHRNWNHSWSEREASRLLLTVIHKPNISLAYHQQPETLQCDWERRGVIIREEKGRDKQMQTDPQQQQQSDWHSILVKSLRTEYPMSCLSTAIKCVSVQVLEANLIWVLRGCSGRPAPANPLDIKSGSVRVQNS